MVLQKRENVSLHKQSNKFEYKIFSRSYLATIQVVTYCIVCFYVTKKNVTLSAHVLQMFC